MSRLRRQGVITGMDRERECALVAGLKAGEPGAFDEAFEAYNRRLLSFLPRMSGNRAVAEDLAAERWMRLVARGRELEEGTQVGAWLFTVARNLFVSHCRSRLRHQEYTSDLVMLWPVQLPRSPY